MISRRKFGTLIVGTTAALATGVSLAEARPTTVKMPDIHMKHDLKEKRDSGNHIYCEWIAVDNLFKKREEVLHSGKWDIVSGINKDTHNINRKVSSNIKKRGKSLHVTVYLNKENPKEGFVVFKHSDTKGWPR